MAKRNLFEKLGLVQAEEPQDDHITYDELMQEPIPDAATEFVDGEVEVPNKDLLGVADVYDSNNLGDTSQSIYKVAELIGTLPKEMPDKTKQDTVHSIMSAIGLDQSEVILDANNRCAILNSSYGKKNEELRGILTENNDRIANLKIEIEELQKQNSDISSAIETNERTVKDETEKISSLIKFIGG